MTIFYNNRFYLTHISPIDGDDNDKKLLWLYIAKKYKLPTDITKLIYHVVFISKYSNGWYYDSRVNQSIEIKSPPPFFSTEHILQTLQPLIRVPSIDVWPSKNWVCAEIILEKLGIEAFGCSTTHKTTANRVNIGRLGHIIANIVSTRPYHIDLSGHQLERLHFPFPMAELAFYNFTIITDEEADIEITWYFTDLQKLRDKVLCCGYDQEGLPIFLGKTFLLQENVQLSSIEQKYQAIKSLILQ